MNIKTVPLWLLGDTFLISVIAIGVVLRVLSALLISVGFDGNYYVAMGVSFSSRGEFLLPGGDPGSPGMTLSYSHHLSPLWPMLLGVAFAVFGTSVAVVKATSLCISIAVLFVGYWLTRDLYGGICGLEVCAVLAVLPELILDVGRAYSENLTMVLFITTIWAIIKSLSNRKYMIWGGLAAGLAFLSRASVGYFFGVAGVAGLWWRFHFMRFDVFRDRSYLVAIGIFGILVGGWSYRNVARFGYPHWETDGLLTSYTLAAISNPLSYVSFLLLTVLFFGILLFSIGIFFIPEMRVSLGNVWAEEESGLWLGVLLVPGVAAFIAAVLSQLESRGPGVFGLDRIRYLIFAYYPLLCIACRRLDRQMARKSNPKPIRPVVRLPFAKEHRARFGLVFLGLGAGVFSIAVKATWLIPLFVGGVVALFIRPFRARLVVLLIVLAVVSAEVASSASQTAEQDAIEFIANQISLTVVAFDGPQDLYYDLSTFALPIGITIVDIGNLSKAMFVVSNDTSSSYPAFTLQRIFYDRNSQGIIQSAFLVLLGHPTVTVLSPIAVHKRNLG